MDDGTAVEQPRIVIPSKYKCDRHSWYSDVSECTTCMEEFQKQNCVKVSELNGKTNLVFAVVIEDGKMCQVINTNDETTLAMAERRIRGGIDYVLMMTEKARQAKAIQVAQAVPSADVLSKIRG